MKMMMKKTNDGFYDYNRLGDLLFIFHKNHKTTIYAALSFIIATALTLGLINIANRKTAFITFSTSNACHDTLIETAEGKTLFSHL
ncbi:MAG: hypothetical protein J6P91_00005, partial [Methanobrevibacter sp.]|nr:hypothetical protein [Methanobrevibacter sp.]